MKLRLSLRVFFIALTLLCLWLGGLVHRTNLQRRAMAWLTQSGGRGSYGYQLDWSPTNESQPNGPDWLRGIVGIDFFESVKRINLDGTEVVNLAPLSGLRRLESLQLRTTQVIDLAPLSTLRSLSHLNLDSTNVSDVTPLSKLRLKTLNLFFTEVSDVRPLAKITSLESLILSDTLVREKDYRWLQLQLPNCDIEWNANRFD